ncbi:hypothetical protein Tco_1268898 [Tanacetum coccineum]
MLGTLEIRKKTIGEYLENYAFMACNSSGSDTEVTSCSKECKESYAKLKKLYDEQREQLRDASQLWYEEKIRFMKIDLDDKTDALTYHKKLLAEAEKEKEDLKAKMSARDKAGLGYGNQMNKSVLSYENKVFQSVFVSRTSETKNSPVNDRYAEGMHVVPPLMTGIYIPSGPDKEIDDSQFTYGPNQSKPSESDARSSDFNSCESNYSKETHESIPEPVVNEPNVVSQPKVWSDAPIIEEYESDSEDEHVSLPTKEQEIPSFADKHVELNKQKGKGNVQRENKPVWNNVQRMNHQNQFVPKAVLTRTGKIPVNTARHNFNRQEVPINAARKVNTVKPILVLLREKGKLLLSPQQVVIGDHKYITGTKSPNTMVDQDYPYRALQNKGIVNSGCSRHMTGNKAYLAEYQDFNGGPVAFGGSKGYITGKGKIKTGKLDFEDVCFVKELQHFNLFSVSHMCDKKNKVLFTDTECLVLSSDFKFPDEN